MVSKLKIAKVLQKTIDPLSIIAYGSGVFAYDVPHNVVHAGIALGAGAAMTAFARISEYLLNRTAVPAVAPATVQTPSSATISVPDKLPAQTISRKEARINKRLVKIAAKAKAKAAKIEKTVPAYVSEATEQIIGHNDSTGIAPSVTSNIDTTSIPPPATPSSNVIGATATDTQFVGERHKNRVA